MMKRVIDWVQHPSADTGVSFFDTGTWTTFDYPTLAERVVARAGILQAQGIGRGDRIAIILPTGVGFFEYFFATMYLGAIPTVLAPAGYHGQGDYAEFVNYRLDVLEPALVVSEGYTFEVLQKHSAVKSWRVVNGCEPAGEGMTPTFAPAGPDEFALIQFTSGTSSGRPRGVPLTAGALTAQLQMLGDWTRRTDGPTVVSSWLPMHHDMGLIGTFLSPVIRGENCMFMRPEAFIRKPADWLATFAMHGATGSAAPNFSLEYITSKVKPEDLEGFDLGSWYPLIVGSDRINWNSFRAFNRLLAPYGLRSDALMPAYGMAEAVLAVSLQGLGKVPTAVVVEYDSLAEGADLRIAGRWRLDDENDPKSLPAGQVPLVSCGQMLPGVTVVALDEGGGQVGEGNVGEFFVRSPSLARQYIGDPSQNDRFTGGGYKTGDIGFVLDGEVYVLGRIGDSVKVRGVYVTAEDVEQAIVNGVKQPSTYYTVVVGDVAQGAAAVVCVTSRSGDADPIPLVAAASQCGFPTERIAVMIMDKAAIPRTSSGKPQRSRIWSQFLTRDGLGKILYMGRELAVSEDEFDIDLNGSELVIGEK